MTEDKKMPEAESSAGKPSRQEEAGQTAPQHTSQTETPVRSPRAEDSKEGAEASSQSDRPLAERNDDRSGHAAGPDITDGRVARKSTDRKGASQSSAPDGHAASDRNGESGDGNARKPADRRSEGSNRASQASASDGHAASDRKGESGDGNARKPADRRSEGSNRASQASAPDGHAASDRKGESGDGNALRSSECKPVDRRGTSRDAGNRSGNDRSSVASDGRNSNNRSGKSDTTAERKSSDRTTGSNGRNTAKPADRKPLDRSVKPLDRSVKPRSGSDRTSTGESRSASRNRVAANASQTRSGGRRTWREYALQLLVVIIGVAVAFIGSGLVGRWQEQRKVRSAMQLVYEELKTNRIEMERICRYLDRDRRGMLLLREAGTDYRKVPVDSLEKYRFVPGVTDEFDGRSDALEVLRTTGSVADKKLLFDVVTCYSWMERFAASVEKYNEQKRVMLNHLIAGGANGSIGGSGSVESWRMMMNDPMCAAFLTGERFDADLLEGEAADRIGRTAELLNDKYGFE